MRSAFRFELVRKSLVRVVDYDFPQIEHRFRRFGRCIAHLPVLGKITRSGKACRVVCNAVFRFSDSRPAVERTPPGSRSSACASASCGQPSNRPRPSTSASPASVRAAASGKRDVRNRSAQPLSAGFAPARKPFETVKPDFYPVYKRALRQK